MTGLSDHHGRNTQSTARRKPPTGRKSNVAPKNGQGAKRKPKASPELREEGERAVSRAKALEALYRPLQDAEQGELQKTKSGRKLLAEAHAFAKEFGELFEGITSRKTPREERDLRARERLEKFRQQCGDQFLAARAQHVHLQPSVEAVALVLRPEMAAHTTLVSKTSFLRSMLLQPQVPEEVVTLRQGLGNPPPLVQSCIIPPYDRNETYFIPAGINIDDYWGLSAAQRQNGRVVIQGEAMTFIPIPVGVCLASAYVGHDFPVPPGPTSYKTTISYDWNCSGWGFALFGVAIVNVNLAIVIDKRDGTRETHARETTLLTVPAFGSDGFNHDALDVKVTIPFKRDGSNGTVRIMVGADGHTTVISPCGGGKFMGEATIREICLTSVG